MNLIYRVSLTLFIDSKLLDIIMNLSKKRGKKSFEKNYNEQNSKQSSNQSHCCLSIIFPKQKK